MSTETTSSAVLFDREIAAKKVADMRFDVLKQPIPQNTSVSGAKWDLYLPQQGASMSTTGIPCFNTPARGGQLEFDISMQGAQRAIDFKGSNLNLTFRFEWVSALGVAGDMKATDSIPFDLPLRIIDSFSVSSKGASAVNLVSDVGGNELRKHVMHRLFTTMTHDAAVNSEVFFAPVMEQALDTNFALSAESTARSAAWCQDRALPVMRSIPLSWLCPAMDKQALFTNISQLHFAITLLPCNDGSLAFGTYGLLAGNAYVGQLNVYVSDISISLRTVTPSFDQSNEIMAAAGKRIPENVADIGQYINTTNFNSTQLNLGNVSNMQMVTWGVAATDMPACVVGANNYFCINSSQFVPQSISFAGSPPDVVTFGHGISSVSVQYGTVVMPERTLQLDSPEKIQHLYKFYVSACHRSGSYSTNPFITMPEYSTAYQIFAIQVVDALGYVFTPKPSNCYVNMTSSGVAGTSTSAFNLPIIFVRHCAEAASILADGTTIRQAVAV